MKIEFLTLDPDRRSEEEIKIDRARINGIHEGIKEVIKQIEKIEILRINMGYSVSTEFVKLKNQLGMMVYKNWPQKVEE